MIKNLNLVAMSLFLAGAAQAEVSSAADARTIGRSFFITASLHDKVAVTAPPCRDGAVNNAE